MATKQIVIAAASIAMLTFGPAQAQEQLSPGGGAVADELEIKEDHGRRLALREEATAYAEDFGLIVEEAERRLIRQEALQDVLARVQERVGRGFAGAYVEHQPQLRGVVRLVEGANIDAETKKAIEQSKVPVEVVERAGPGLEELRRRLENALPRLQELGGGLVGAEIDERTGEIVLFYQGGEKAPAAPEARRRAQEQARELLQVPLRIETVEKPVGDGHTRGGADLSNCTAGFVVRHPLSGTRGYITAGHCPNDQTYFEFGGVSYSTAFVDEIQDADQDVQWHTTPHIELPRFYASSTTSDRPLNSRRTRSEQSVGGYVCHRGKTTGYSCGTIQTKTFAPTYANACPGTTCSPVWIRVSGSNLKCFPGDSGGPWFLVYTAYGIYKGQSSSGTAAGGCTWAFYMASNYFGIDLVYD
jgi:streptogrisin C